MKEIKFVKVGTRLLEADAQRLKTVAKRAGFSSDYALVRYLIHTFLRVADPENDVIDAPVPPELADLFTTDEALKKDLDAAYESLRRVTYAHNIQRFNKRAGRLGKQKADAASSIEAEVAEMFDGYEAEGAQKTYKADILKRTLK